MFLFTVLFTHILRITYTCPVGYVIDNPNRDDEQPEFISLLPETFDVMCNDDATWLPLPPGGGRAMPSCIRKIIVKNANASALDPSEGIALPPGGGRAMPSCIHKIIKLKMSMPVLQIHQKALPFLLEEGEQCLLAYVRSYS
jgi:hypothetical protein